MNGNNELVENEGDGRGGGVGQIRQQNMVVDPHVNHPDRLPCCRTEVTDGDGAYGAASAEGADFAGVGKCCFNAEFHVATASGVAGAVEVPVISAAGVHCISPVTGDQIGLWNVFFFCFFLGGGGGLCTFVQGRLQPTQSQLIQIYSVEWTDVYDTHTTLNTEQNQLAIKATADN